MTRPTQPEIASAGGRPAGSAQSLDGTGVSKGKIALGVTIVLLLAGAYAWLSQTGALDTITDEQALRGTVERLGWWGPLALIGLMVAAIVMSPIPSGPIAIVAGAAYGPLWGTLYVVAGAEIGAIIAFWIARCLGYDAVRSWLTGQIAFLARRRSQNALMLIVFASRLVPFISFDAVSYAAGLTPLAFWRFALATLAGVIPASLALTFLGREALRADPRTILLLGIGVGALTLLPIAARLIWTRYRRKPAAARRER
jgi:uncharacterized membrane protein YdjX (TVP38/TMEM64 family)